jgi:hypothetical protein
VATRLQGKPPLDAQQQKAIIVVAFCEPDRRCTELSAKVNIPVDSHQDFQLMNSSHSTPSPAGSAVAVYYGQRYRWVQAASALRPAFAATTGDPFHQSRPIQVK